MTVHSVTIEPDTMISIESITINLMHIKQQT